MPGPQEREVGTLSQPCQGHATVAFKGQPVRLGGAPIEVGGTAPDFEAVGADLAPVRLGDGAGKVLILSCVPSLDTPVCQAQTRRFNLEAGKLAGDLEVWTISMDLPFAQKRWTGAAGARNVRTLSDFRDRSFARSYGVLIEDGPLAGLTARAVFVVGRDGRVRHAEYVPDIGNEPDYAAALAAARHAIQS